MLTQGLERAELQREVTGVDGERRRTTLCMGARRCGAPPVIQAPRVDAWQRCEGGPGVSEAQESPAVRNFSNPISPAAAGPERNSRRLLGLRLRRMDLG